MKFFVERTFGIKTGFGFKEILCWKKQGLVSKKFSVGIKQDLVSKKFSVGKNRIWFQRNSLLE